MEAYGEQVVMERKTALGVMTAALSVLEIRTMGALEERYRDRARLGAKDDCATPV